MINYEEFLAKYYSTANTAKQEDIKRFLEHLTEIAGGKTAKDVLADKKLLCKASALILLLINPITVPSVPRRGRASMAYFKNR